jgi:hypothetical protein
MPRQSKIVVDPKAVRPAQVRLKGKSVLAIDPKAVTAELLPNYNPLSDDMLRDANGDGQKTWADLVADQMARSDEPKPKRKPKTRKAGMTASTVKFSDLKNTPGKAKLYSALPPRSVDHFAEGMKRTIEGLADAVLKGERGNVPVLATFDEMARVTKPKRKRKPKTRKAE